MDSVLIEYIQSGKAWLLVGSGPSNEMGYPSWERLASIAIQTARNEQVGADFARADSAMTKGDYPQVFSEIRPIVGEDRLLQVLRDNVKPTHAGKVYELITRWPIRLARGGGYCRAPWWRLTTRYHGYTISDKAMKVRMLHCELKWEIPTQ